MSSSRRESRSNSSRRAEAASPGAAAAAAGAGQERTRYQFDKTLVTLPPSLTKLSKVPAKVCLFVRWADACVEVLNLYMDPVYVIIYWDPLTQSSFPAIPYSIPSHTPSHNLCATRTHACIAGRECLAGSG